VKVKALIETVMGRILSVGAQRSTDTRRDFLLQRMPERAVCAEIGVFRGNFSSRILEVTQPAELHLIDPWKFEDTQAYEGARYGGRSGRNQAHMDRFYRSVVARFKSEIATRIVHIHRSSSAIAAEGFPDDYFDWIYIDGNHRYEFVKADLDGFYPKVKYGGYITGDDYGRQGWWDDGVTRAVDEFRTRCKTILIQSSQFILQKT